MCGIAGIWGVSDKGIIKTMLNSIKHRGPDDEGILVDDQLSIGMVRLSIMDTSDAGHQPMYSSCKNVVIIYNGEIYNHREQREFLKSKGYKFYSNSDTEVILNLYLFYGDSFLTKLRGMFSIAIYDKRLIDTGGKKLLIARDNLGIKPLYYSTINDKIVFGSELKAVISSGLVKQNISKHALIKLLKFGSVQQPDTIFEEIKMLEEGSYLVINNSKIENIKYSEIELAKDKSISLLSYNDQINLLDNALIDSVNRQIISDAPIGAFLSGGVDSSLLVALMSKNVKDLKTFSVGFESEGSSIDETIDSKKIADFIGTDHNQVVVTGNDFKNSFFKIVKSLDQPSVDGVNSYFVSYAASKDVSVSLSGTGGDELFAGYPWFLNSKRFFSENLTNKEFLLSYVFKAKVFDRPSLKDTTLGEVIEKYRSKSSFTSFFGRQHYIFSNKGIGSILNNDLLEFPSSGEDLGTHFSIYDVLKDDSVLNRVTGLCLKGYLRNQLLRDIDVMSMTHSLEVRVPYLDPEIVKIALSIPDLAKIDDSNKNLDSYTSSYRDLGSKKILIDVAKKYLPKDFDLQPKRGFGMPFDFWLRNNIRIFVEDAFSEESIVKRGIFSVKGLKSLYSNFLEGKGSWAQIWLITVIEFWFRENIDN